MSLITVERSFSTPDTSTDVSVHPNSDHDGSSTVSNEDFVISKTSVISVNKFSRRPSTGKILTHLQNHLTVIMRLLRPQDSLNLIVSLQPSCPSMGIYKYLCIVSTMSENDVEESIILGIDMDAFNAATVGLTIPIYQNFTLIPDGDGGFKLTDKIVERLFKPNSVQALWKVFQELQRCLSLARANSYHSNGLNHTWIQHYERLPRSDAPHMQDWLKMDDIENFGKVDLIKLHADAERVQTEALIQKKLREIMSSVDLEEVTVSSLRIRVEEALNMDLHAYRHFIEDMVLQIYGQMDEASTICEHLLLGSTFNASNRRELETRNVTHILNVTREIDNFFPSDQFVYKNVREFDLEESDLLSHWEDTHRFINLAKENGTRCLVHCKMGVSRSAATVVAYVMKEFHLNVEKALELVKSKRTCIKPNDGFMRQLHTYNGILEASSNRNVFQKELSSSVGQMDTQMGITFRKASLPVMSDSRKAKKTASASLTFELSKKGQPATRQEETEPVTVLRPTSVGGRLRPDNSWIIPDEIKENPKDAQQILASDGISVT